MATNGKSTGAERQQDGLRQRYIPEQVNDQARQMVHETEKLKEKAKVSPCKSRPQAHRGDSCGLLHSRPPFMSNDMSGLS